MRHHPLCLTEIMGGATIPLHLRAMVYVTSVRLDVDIDTAIPVVTASIWKKCECHYMRWDTCETPIVDHG